MSERRQLASSVVAEFVASVRLRDAAPPHALDAATERILDTLAVAISGATSAGAVSARRAAQGQGEAGNAVTVWGTSARVTPSWAALCNAIATHAEDFDDTHTRGIVHGSACIVPAAWAAAEAHDLSIADVQRGVLVGWELAARLGLASAGAFHRRGLHTTSVVGVFGAAAATASVLRLSHEETVACLGLAGSAAGGLNVYLQDGSQGKLLNPGFAAQAGYQAAVLAQHGMTGPAHVFEGRHGLFEALGDGIPEVARALSDLGKTWEIEQVSVKPYPACHFAHATIEAAIDLHRLGVCGPHVQSIVCYLPEPTWDLLCRPWESKVEPHTDYALRFSLPWLVALALSDGEITRASFAQGVRQRPDVREIARRVQVVQWNDTDFPRTFPGRVEVTTGDGMLAIEHLVNAGHPERRFTRPELRRKFELCLEHVMPSRETEAVWSAVQDPAARVRAVAARLSRDEVLDQSDRGRTALASSRIKHEFGHE